MNIAAHIFAPAMPPPADPLQLLEGKIITGFFSESGFLCLRLLDGEKLRIRPPGFELSEFDPQEAFLSPAWLTYSGGLRVDQVVRYTYHRRPALRLMCSTGRGQTQLVIAASKSGNYRMLLTGGGI